MQQIAENYLHKVQAAEAKVYKVLKMLSDFVEKNTTGKT